MSTPTAKDLLAQADRLMRQRTPEELPVLTDLVIEEIEITSLTERMDDTTPSHVRPAWVPALTQPAPAAVPPNPYRAAPPDVAVSARVAAAVDADVFGMLPRIAHHAPTRALAASGESAATTAASGSNAREQFNAQLVAKLEEMQHGVYSQVMQQLEIYASGTLKAHLRDTLLAVLTDIARDIANQVAEDTSNQVREVVSKAVESEIARLREQLAAKRRT